MHPRGRSLLLIVLSGSLLVGGGPQAVAAVRPGQPEDGRWIVAVHREADRTRGGTAAGPRDRGPGPRSLPRIAGVPGDARAHREILRLIRTLDVRPTAVYRHAFDGFAAELSRAQLAALRRDPAVRVLAPDRSIGLETTADSSLVRKTRLRHPVVPTGIRRTRADRGSIVAIDGVRESLDVDVAIVDTGIAPHPDLRIAGGYDCSGPDHLAWRDREGHGTHVAGTVGALDNDLGVVGVAPGARLWAIKILGDNAEGMLSFELCGLDRVLGMRDPGDAARPRIEVVNMSIGAWLYQRDDRDCGRRSGDLFHEAVCALVADGTVVVVAAGNQSTNAAARTPAAYDEAITVSALADFDGRPGGTGDQDRICPWYSRDVDDTYGDFSNFGVDVDLMAPGKCILSTEPRGLYGWSTGTSMATPHVAGAAALLFVAHPGARPGQVRAALIDAASRDWSTWTDPDDRPDRLLDVSALGPLRDFDLAADGPADELALGGMVTIPVRVERHGGHEVAVTVRVPGLPDGLSAEVAPSSTRRDALTVTLWNDGTVAAGPLDVTLRATDGELVRETAVSLRVRSGGPTVDVTSPDEGGLTLLDGDATTVAWTEADPGAPPAERRIRRQHGQPSTPGRCAGVDWSDDGPGVDVAELDPSGSPETGWTFEATDLAADGCYRWLIRLVDEDGASARFATGAVLRDTTDPAAPNVTASGDGVWQSAANRIIWVRGGNGELHLAAGGRDAASGVASQRFGPLDPPAGWSHDPGPVEGDPGEADLRWDAGAVDTALEVSAVDGVGRRGAPRRVSIRVDQSAPSAARWSAPRPGTFEVTGYDPELQWADGNDAGSGVALLQHVQRQVAVPTSDRSCRGASWEVDGPPRYLAHHSEEAGLRSGRCYRWVLRATDRVGNLGRAVVSGVLLVDLLPPVADFITPDEGTAVSRTSTTVTVRWTDAERGGVGGSISRSLEREVTRLRDGSCDRSGWRPDGAPVSGPSPSTQSGLRPGSCYRWRLNLADRQENPSAGLSGTLRIVSR